MGSHQFDTVLIANRGEIALRINRTAQRLGYRTVAVYSDADGAAPHRHAADLAVHVGAASPSASYLNIDSIIAAALTSRAQAIHPGYGFLAENAALVAACDAAGLIFIGPPASAMRAMANKAEAKHLMAAAGVPCIPGYQGNEQSDSAMLHAASQIAYPLMIKAVAGGGGRGMRCVTHADDFLAALQSARSEAQHAFANATVILEKAIIAPRHIEVQVFADTHGNIVHLGERDCSVQRRHQKLIEETPSPAVSPELRARMGEVSIAAARAIGYIGAGTLEFLLDQDGNFYFMEMNTRLQVEHAVTEAVTGVDLVEWQLRIAGGEALPLTQAQIDQARNQSGHAIEVRLCAEDVQQHFLPQSGQVELWRVPVHARCDHALEDGMTVSPYYDSMLAKVIAHGKDRPEALRQMNKALQDCVLLGIKNNLQFLANCLKQDEFIEGQATTAFIEKHIASLIDPEAKTAAEADTILVQIATMLLARQDSLGKQAKKQSRFPAELFAWASSVRYPQTRRMLLDGLIHETRVTTLDKNQWQISTQNTETKLLVLSEREHSLSLQINGHIVQIDYRFDTLTGKTCYFRYKNRQCTAVDTTYAVVTRADKTLHSSRITAPMNGRVVAVAVKAGDVVTLGQTLIIIEAMKMEHSITAPRAGMVQTVPAVVGDQVAPGHLLFELAVESARPAE